MTNRNRNRYWVCLAAALALGACRSGPEVFVPVQETADLQYAYAVNFRERHAIEMQNREEPEKVAKTRATVREVFKRVIDYFPDDRNVTPLAKLELADMKAGFDSNGVEAGTKDYKKAIKQFQALRNEYPEYEFIQAKSRYDEGRCWVKLKRYEEAQQLFLYVRDAYMQSENRGVSFVARLAAQSYQTPFVR